LELGGVNTRLTTQLKLSLRLCLNILSNLTFYFNGINCLYRLMILLLI
jgi:hypothetical protein